MWKNNSAPQLCEGCLSTNRNLTSIENYYHLYQRIVVDIIDMENNSDATIPLMCWECNAMLKNIEKFRQKVLEAKRCLSRVNRRLEYKTLSNLNIYNDLKIIHVNYDENNAIKIEIKAEYIEDVTEIPVDVKSSDLCEALDSVDREDDLIENKDENIKNESIGTDNDNSVDINDVHVKKNKAKKKYRVIYVNDEPRMYKRVKIDEVERLYWVESENKRRKLLTFKCDYCASGFRKEISFLRHMQTYHSKTNGEFTCDVCKMDFPLKADMCCHIKEHYTKYACNICNYQCYHVQQMKKHLCSAHRRAVECIKCGIRFEHLPHFHRHYKELHSKVTCDYCGSNFTKKKRLIKHIGLRHKEHKCVECNKRYMTFHALLRHTNLHHVKSARELCYCVECNIQFDNVTLYTRHLKRSVKHHTIVGVPCPECDKVYHRRHVMINHYNLVHLKRSSHYCDRCDRYFLNGFRLRQHTASVHDKLPRVKNKVCPYCQRAFSTNRILDNHIRTHTGERPFACARCSVTFAQRQALVSHTRAIHKILDFK